ncbi:hypothetical protein D3C78_1411500 [compost metagenome]
MRFYHRNPLPRDLCHFVMFDKIGRAFGPVGGKLVVQLTGYIKIKRRIGIEVGGVVHINMTGCQILNAPWLT